jgi:hypothetical protein
MSIFVQNKTFIFLQNKTTYNNKNLIKNNCLTRPTIMQLDRFID